jgi:hypothetical protein
MTDRELMQQALDALVNAKGYIFHNVLDDTSNRYDIAIEALRARLAQPEPQEIKIEFKEWVHPHMGLVPVDPKTPLILKAVIREEA